MSAARNGSLKVRLRAQPESAHDLRRQLESWLEASKVSRSDAFAVILASAEAFANAVEHPHHASVDEVTIEGSVSDDCVTIWIRDYGTWRSDQSQKEHGGLGLAIIEALMDAVRVDRAPEGTTISMRRRLALSTRT